MTSSNGLEAWHGCLAHNRNHCPECRSCGHFDIAAPWRTREPANDDETPRCLNQGPDCEGAVEYRMPLSGTGRSFPRCEKHWSDRLDLDQGLRERYPEHQPSDFDPLYAGESWDGD